MDSVRTFSRTLYAENEEDARAEEELLRRRLGKALKFVNDAIGVNAWSRDLDDHKICIAFCVPDEVYDDKEICDRLEDWFGAVFGAHYLIFEGEWRDTSTHEKYSELSLYEVDWCGSRSRGVHIGPHLYMDIRPCFPGAKPPCDPVDRPCDLPAWTVRHEQPNEYTINVVVVVDGEGLKGPAHSEGEGH